MWRVIVRPESVSMAPVAGSNGMIGLGEPEARAHVARASASMFIWEGRSSVSHFCVCLGDL